jgi:hypothetical protein
MPAAQNQPLGLFPRQMVKTCVFKTGRACDIDALTRLMRKFADAMTVDLPAVR